MKRKALNPVAIVLNRNFSEVSETIIFAIVTKTDKYVNMILVGGAEDTCKAIKSIESLDETNTPVEVSVYVKQPFTNCFVPGKRAISAAMKLYFPEAKVELIDDEKVDEVKTETVEAIEVVETAPKKKVKTSVQKHI